MENKTTPFIIDIEATLNLEIGNNFIDFRTLSRGSVNTNCPMILEPSVIKQQIYVYAQKKEMLK